jgi:hypothetical protein
VAAGGMMHATRVAARVGQGVQDRPLLATSDGTAPPPSPCASGQCAASMRRFVQSGVLGVLHVSRVTGYAARPPPLHAPLRGACASALGNLSDSAPAIPYVENLALCSQR